MPANVAISENYESSSEEEELNEGAILESLYRNYKTFSSSEDTRLSSFLENALHSGATCLICIGTVRRADAIWSCKKCFCFFHLNCIRRWANDSVAQLKSQQQQNNEPGYYNHLGEFVHKVKRALQWFCPQCRKAYEPSERPSEYECFCGKEVNPPAQPFLMPHSCGEICGKELKPKCGHKCTLLCHPGPCPPCAQYAVTTCQCSKSVAKSMRCSEKIWLCAKKCGKRMACGHVCEEVCHSADKCPPCTNTSKQSCECGNEVSQRNCADLKWHCKKVCGLRYACGHHTCKKVCHSGPCGDCPLGVPRSCPCGKTKKVVLNCTETIDTCGDTCQKLLSCGEHTCTQRCHRGACNLCVVIVKKKCRCGAREKELPCSKDFMCETKCKQTRDCDKHACNKKCCDGQCPPCDKICGKPLSCKKHKCQSICHDGPCYPCQRQSVVNCRCGKTSRNVPCGRERTARILCNEPCRIPSKCHHAIKHRCHKHDCPPCSQKCGLRNDTTDCEHICEAKCHAAIKVKKEIAPDPTKRWEGRKTFEYKKLPHPQCKHPVTVTCIGGHETADWPCCNSKPTSCQRKCNRALRCGNHKCEVVCHSVPDISDMTEQKGCASCIEGCNISRPAGCTHPCPKSCHKPPCAPCQVNIKTKCHCGISQVIYKCSEFYSLEGSIVDICERQEALKRCGSRCLKNYACGHRCAAICHSGSCPEPEGCRKKVRIFCECKRLKIDISCDKHRGGFTTLPCDDNCVITRTKQEQLAAEAAYKLKLEEDAKNRLEVEQFEKKFSKRKYKERKVAVEQVKRSIDWKLISIILSIVAAISIAVVLALHEES